MTKQDKVAKVMHEWKNGRLTSNGKKVTDYDQAIAIALSEAGLSKNIKKDEDMNEYSKGGNVIERRYVNKDEDYETRYAKDEPMRKGYNEERMFAVGGEVGNTVSFKGDYGTPRSGVVKEKRGSSYIVATDDGDRLVDSYEVISFSETPVAKKKRFGFFAEGGSIESKKQAILDFINSFPDKPKDWSEATDDLPELHYDIADEYGSKYDFDFNKRSSLRDRNLRHKQHAKSLLNKLSDEEVDNIYSKWEETLEDKFEGGGSIEEYKQAEKDYDKYGEYLEDAIEDENESDIKKYTKLMDEAETKMHRYERKYENGGGVGFKERSERDSIKLAKAYQKLFDSNFEDKEYNNYEKIVKETQIPKEELQKIEYYISTTPKGQQRMIDIYRYWGVKYEGGGEIQSKIDKLQAVVNSKMLPESVKETAKKKIAELEKELHESKETKAEKKAEHKEGGKEARLDEKEELNATIQKLYAIEGKAEDLINYQSGGIQGQSVDKIKKYVEYVNKEVSKLDVPFGSEVYDVLEDENAHSLNLTLGLLGFYKNEKDSGEWAKKHEQYTKLVDVVNEVKGGGKVKPTTTKEIVGYGLVDPISGDIVASKKTIAELMEASKKLEKTKGFEDMSDLVYEIVKKDDKNVIGNKVTSVDINLMNVAKKELKKPTTRKAPIKKAVAKKVVVKKEIEAPAKPKADHKKLVAKLKAKKGAKEYSNKASLVPFTDKRRKRNEASDRKREALPLGKRVSADGNVYWENRLNRGDLDKGDKFEKGGEVKGSGWGLNLNW